MVKDYMVIENLRNYDDIGIMSESRSRKININRELSIYTTKSSAMVNYL